MKHPLHVSSYRPPFDSPVHRLDGRVKLLALVAFIVAVVGTPVHAAAAMAAYAVLLLVSLFAARVPPGYVVARWLLVLPLIAAAAVLPLIGPGPTASVAGLSLSRPGLATLASVAVKTSLAVVAVTLLGGSTHFADVLKALQRLRLPTTLVLMLSFTWRYLFLLVDEASRMKRARDLRHYGGRWLWQGAVVGRMIGTLFLRSFERGERVHAAMVARGFDGLSNTAFRGGHPARLTAGDWLVAAGWSAAVLAIRLGLA